MRNPKYSSFAKRFSWSPLHAHFYRLKIGQSQFVFQYSLSHALESLRKDQRLWNPGTILPPYHLPIYKMKDGKDYKFACSQAF